MKTRVLLSALSLLTISSCRSTDQTRSQAVDAVRSALDGMKIEKTFDGGQTVVLGYEDDMVIIGGRFPINWGSKPLAQK